MIFEDLSWAEKQFNNDKVITNKKILELTLHEFLNSKPEALGYNGSHWSVDQIVVDCITVFDKNGSIGSIGKILMKEWTLRVFK